MKIEKHITFLGLLIYIIGFTSVLAAQNTKSKEEQLNEIIQEAVLRIYTDPIGVIKIGDSLYNNSSNDINEKVTGLLLITDAFIAIRNYPKAHEYMNSAKQLLGKNISPFLRVKVLHRFAYQHFQLHLYDESLRYLKEAEEQNEKEPNTLMYLSNKGYLNAVRGLIYRQLEGCEVANRYFQRSIKSYEESEDELTKVNLSIVHYNRGNCYLSLEQFEKAKNEFQTASLSADRYGKPQNTLKLFAEKGMASYYSAIEQHQTAIDILNTLSEDAEKIGDKSLMRSIASDLAANYLEIDNWELYEKHNKTYNTLNKELKDSEINATIFSLEESDTEYQSRLHNIISVFYIKIGSVLLLSILAILLFVNLILKKRDRINTIRIAIFKNKQ